MRLQLREHTPLTTMSTSARATEVDETTSPDGEGSPERKRPGRRRRESKYTAHTADKYELYQ